MVLVTIMNLENNTQDTKTFETYDEFIFWLELNKNLKVKIRTERYQQENKNKFTGWDILRFKRNKKLKSTDHTQLADVSLTSEEKKEYREYRKYLRDLPSYYDERTSKTAEVLDFDGWKRLWKRY